MARISSGKVTLRRHKKILKLAKGFKRANSTLSTYAHEQVKQSLADAYIGRKQHKRRMKTHWLNQLNVVLSNKQYKYSSLIGNLRKKNILLNAKTLALLTASNCPTFAAIVRHITSQIN